jgi:hypothetical protein
MHGCEGTWLRLVLDAADPGILAVLRFDELRPVHPQGHLLDILGITDDTAGC